MPIVGPDDPARDLRWIWLGPKSVRLPAAPVSAYGVFFTLWIGVSLVAFVSVANPKQWLIATLIAAIPALLLTKWIHKHVDSVRTLRYYRDMVRVDARSPRPPVDPGPDAGGTEYRISPAIFTRRDHP